MESVSGQTFVSESRGSSKESPEQNTRENPQNSKENSIPGKPDGNVFECNICLESPNDPVVSLCGHLFCWPCLHSWLSVLTGEGTCPVCKAVVDPDKVVPIYGRNSSNEDPRTKNIPPRPTAQRTEASPNQDFNPDFIPFPGFNIATAGGFHMTFGFGPLAVIGAVINVLLNRNLAGQQANNGVTSSIFLCIAFALIFFVIFL